MDPSRLRGLRERAARGQQVTLRPDELESLLDTREAGVELADAVAAVLSVEHSEPSGVRPAHRDERMSASEIRNRFRRRIEEASLKMTAALAKFRAAAEKLG